MPGPRAGYAFLPPVKVKSAYGNVERHIPARLATSDAVHNHCQSHGMCTGAGCHVKTGKTTGRIPHNRNESQGK